MAKTLQLIAAAMTACLLGACAPKPHATSTQNAEVTQAQAESGLYKAHQEWLRRVVPRASINGQHDTLSAYAQKCDLATGITVPHFNCDVGTEVPDQGTVPATIRNATHCNQPNVLNGHCDPGSKFQVLPGSTADAVAVAHCRKVGLPIAGSLYNDIAVIQYNKQNGAVCFYQALTNLPGDDIPAPLTAGENPWHPSNAASWMSPAGTEAIGCTGCHDNGGFIRSEYLAQLQTPPNVLPNSGTGFSNLNTPIKYVGLDYATNRSWSIAAPQDANDSGPACTTCHRLAVPNRMAFGMINGTAAHFANLATAANQDSKNPHSPASRIWMRPGQVTYISNAESTATNFHNCAVNFFNSGFATIPQGCTITQLAEPWSDIDAAQFVSQSPTLTAAIAPGSTFNQTLVFTNSGGVRWVGTHTMALASSQSATQPFPLLSFPLGTAQAPVQSLQTVQQVFAVVAPMQPGTYDLAFVLRGPLGQVLAASPTKQIVVAAPNSPTVDNANLTIVSAPGSMRNGVPGSVTVTAQNVGTTTWSSPAYTLRLTNGLRISLPQNFAPVAGSVAPNGSQNFTFGVVCSGSGQGSFTAQMAGNQSGTFGQRVARTIVCQP